MSVKKTVAKRTVKKTATKKVAKKAVAKKVAKKKVVKKAPVKKGGLRKPQIRILQALAKSRNGLTRSQIAEKAEVDGACCTEYLGSLTSEVRLENDKKHFPSLVSLKMIKVEQHDIDGHDVITFSITVLGKKAV